MVIQSFRYSPWTIYQQSLTHVRAWWTSNSCFKHAIWTRMRHLAFCYTHVLLQLDFADVWEAEGEQCLPGSHIQHVVFLAEQQRGVIKDAVCREPLSWSFLRIWKKMTHTHTHAHTPERNRLVQNMSWCLKHRKKWLIWFYFKEGGF